MNQFSSGLRFRINEDGNTLEVERDVICGEQSVQVTVHIPHRNYSLFEIDLTALKKARFLLDEVISGMEKRGPMPSSNTEG